MGSPARQLAEQLARDALLLELTDSLARNLHRYGGSPAVDEYQPWPVCPSCNKHQTFLAQIDMSALPFPASFDLPVLCFFLCLECVGTCWDEEGHGPLGFSVLRFLASGDQQLGCDPSIPRCVEKSIDTVPARSLPPWGCLEPYSIELMELSCAADPDEPWELYLQLWEELSTVSTYDCQVGGYPAFFEEIATPKCTECGREMFLGLQLYSEDVDLLGILGAGSLYYFVCNEHPGSSTLRYQCE